MKYLLSALILFCNISTVMGLAYSDVIIINDNLKYKSFDIPKRHCFQDYSQSYDLEWGEDCEEALMLYFSGNRAALLNETYKKFVSAIKAKDSNAIEKLMEYPLEVTRSQYRNQNIQGDVSYLIANKEEFLTKFDQIFTAKFFVENEKKTIFAKIPDSVSVAILMNHFEAHVFLSCKNDSIDPNKNFKIIGKWNKFLDYEHHVETCPDPEAKIHLIQTYDE